MEQILMTEAAIVADILGKPKGKITKLAGAIDKSLLTLYFKNDSFRELPIHLIPSVNIGIEVDKTTNIVSITCNKEISPLKKGDHVKFFFEDGSFFENKFIVGRSLNGKEVTNFLLVSNLQFLQLSEVHLTHIIINNGIDIIYDFIDKPNDQYLNILEGKRLFKIMCERLVEIKKIMLGITSGDNSSNNDSHTSLLK